MAELVSWMRSQEETKAFHPLLVIATFIVVFLEIHPFQDGNGRLSRVLTTLLLLRAGYAYVPYSSLERVIEQSKDSYYLALRRTQGTIRTPDPDWIRGLGSSCTRYSSKSVVSKRRSSASGSSWPICRNCQ
jgi:Fic family protein